jgi:hypothetical protein
MEEFEPALPFKNGAVDFETAAPPPPTVTV